MSTEDEICFENTLGEEPGMSDEEFKSFVLQKIVGLSEEIWNKTSNTNHDSDNLYAGSAGIAYLFWYLSQQKTLLPECDKYLSRARDLVVKTLNDRKSGQKQTSDSFLFGESGIYLIAAIVFDSCHEDQQRDQYLNQFVQMCPSFLTMDFEDSKRNTFFDGKSGFVSAALLANRWFGSHVIPVPTLQNIGVCLIKSGKYNSLTASSDLPLLFGVDHSLSIDRGSSGILLSLLCIPELTRLHPDFEPHLRTIVDHILATQSENGSYTSEDSPVDWCSGSSGICWLMAKAYLLWSDDKYRQSVVKCGQLVWKRGLSRRGLGLSTGIAGNGYVFLLLRHLTQDKKYLTMARQFAKFVFGDTFTTNYKEPDNPNSLFEGRSGLVCYLVDLIGADKPQIPLFFDIYTKESDELTEDIATISEPITEIVSISDESNSTKQ